MAGESNQNSDKWPALSVTIPWVIGQVSMGFQHRHLFHAMVQSLPR